MPIALLDDRALLFVSGEDAADFLGGLVTCAVDAAGPARHGALLTPQGKIIVDFFLYPRAGAPGGFLLDAPKAQAEALRKRLTMYRLRAKVALADVSGELAVAAAWDGAPSSPARGHALSRPSFRGDGRAVRGAAGDVGRARRRSVRPI